MAIYDRDWYRNSNDGNKKISKEEAEKLRKLVEGTSNNNQTIDEPQKIDEKYARENPFLNEKKIEKEVDELIEHIDKKNKEDEKDRIINDLIDERNKLKSKKNTLFWVILWSIIISVFIIIPILLFLIK